ncbi:NAD(P)-dependent oxidoreductase [Microtetraspora malaysiensis]|uniref:NAD(P)-dependent oxidoreductase n=1 Tax=Microtetraspora malaysiensis TaxID=161358 RepID=UPI003D8F0AA7
MRPRALVLAPMRGPAWARLRELADVIYEPVPVRRPPRGYPAAELAARLAEEHARILITDGDEVSGPVLDLPLMAVACTRAEPVNVDVAAATARGIPVLCAPGRDADGIAELTLALLLAVNRRLLVADRDLRAGRTHDERERHRSWELAGRTFGIVGGGPSARAVTWRMKGLGMRVIVHGPDAPRARPGIDRLIAEADVVSVHGVPVRDGGASGTRGAFGIPGTGAVIGAAEFAAMKPGAIFINTAHPEFHDAEALVGALKTGHLGGAALDHVPPDPHHPLLGMDNVVLTPGIGDGTYDTEVNHSRMICGDIVRLLGGEPPLHCANPEVLGV